MNIPQFCTVPFPSKEEFQKAVDYAIEKGIPFYYCTSGSSFVQGYKRLGTSNDYICGHRDHLDPKQKLLSISEFYEMVDNISRKTIISYDSKLVRHPLA